MSLRSLTEEDLPFVRAWRNAPEVRQNMYSRHEISEAEHRTWFHRMEQDPQALWFIHEDEAGQADGVVYFTQYRPSNGSAFWGFYAGTGAKPGVGVIMEFDALELAFSELGLHKLNCEVLVSNTQVVNLHQKCGFSQEGLFRDFHFDGEHYVDVVRLGILASEWAARREGIQARIARLAVGARG